MKVEVEVADFECPECGGQVYRFTLESEDNSPDYECSRCAWVEVDGMVIAEV